MTYIIIGLIVEVVTELYLAYKGTPLISMMDEVLQFGEHEELRKDYSLKQLHFIFAGLVIFIWPVYLCLLLVK